MRHNILLRTPAVVKPMSSCETTTMLDVMKLSIIVCLVTGCAAAEKCQHLGKEDAFPPKVRNQYYNASYVNEFDEIMVIGDVHGCYTELQMLLDKANVTDNSVLKILAGDLTRKGPKSLEVLRFVQNTPSVTAVRGNNDQKVLSIHYKATHYNFSLSVEDEFIGYLTPDDLDFVHQLPYTISIPSVNAIVVHGGIRPGLPLEDHDAYDLMNIRNLVEDDECAGGFRPIKSHSKGVPWASKWRGPQHVYFAHDHFRNLQLYPFATGLDTSCVNGKFLTGMFIKGPRMGDIVQQAALQKYITFPSFGKALDILDLNDPA